MADNLVQRQEVAKAVVAAGVQIIDGIYALQKLADERKEFISPWVDADFTALPQMTQCSAAILGILIDFVLDPTQQGTNGLVKWLADTGNAGRNLQILMQIRPGA